MLVPVGGARCGPVASFCPEVESLVCAPLRRTAFFLRAILVVPLPGVLFIVLYQQYSAYRWRLARCRCGAPLAFSSVSPERWPLFLAGWVACRCLLQVCL